MYQGKLRYHWSVIMPSSKMIKKIKKIKKIQKKYKIKNNIKKA